MLPPGAAANFETSPSTAPMNESLSLITRLFDHMAWADARTLAALQTLDGPHLKAQDLFAHLLAAEHVWLRRIQQRAPDLVVWPTLDLQGCEALATATHAGFRTVLGGMTLGMLSAPVHYANSAGTPFSTPLQDILLHVTHHGMYHRGQVALLVREAGGTPIATDFISYVREQDA